MVKVSAPSTAAAANAAREGDGTAPRRRPRHRDGQRRGRGRQASCRSRSRRRARSSACPAAASSCSSWGGKPAALVTYGQNLGGIAVIEQPALRAAASAPGRELGPGRRPRRPQPADGLDQRRHRPGARHRARHGAALQPRRRRLHGDRLGAARSAAEAGGDAAYDRRPRADRGPGAGQALRRADRRRRRRHHRQHRRRLRLPGPQRRRQDDIAADDARPDPPHRGHRAPVRPRSDAERAGARGGGRASSRRRPSTRTSTPARTSSCWPPSTAAAPPERIDAGAGDGRAHRPGQGPGRRLLARHAPAAGDRRRAAARPQAAAARRARHRPGPGRHARHAPADPPPRRPGHDRAALQPSAERGRGRLQPGGDRALRARSSTRARSPRSSAAPAPRTAWRRPTTSARWRCAAPSRDRRRAASTSTAGSRSPPTRRPPPSSRRRWSRRAR